MDTLLNQTSVATSPDATTSSINSTPASDVAVVGAGVELASPTTTLDPREQVRVDFYRTYDVMTGVRIAATLGGFFSLMVLLVVYKSRCKSKSLSDEQLNAAAAEAVAQEESQLAAAAAFYAHDARNAPRRSVGNMSAPAMVLSRSMRQSSLGGYSSLDPPTAFYYQFQRGKSLPGSALRFQPAQDERASQEDEEEDEEEEDSVLADPCGLHHHLTVPGGARSRRLSSITCSSSDTSYLERRGSAVELGLPAPPPHRAGGSRLDPSMPEEPWDFYYPIDIQVIQPTPEVSPCASERTLYHQPIELRSMRRSGSVAESVSSLEVPAMTHMAPLASISSCVGSLGEYPDMDTHSVGSDSVFLDDDELDTEDEVEGFSTDSDEVEKSSPPFVPYSQHLLQVPRSFYPRTFAPMGRWGGDFKPKRRLSAPGCSRKRKSPGCGGTLGTPDVGAGTSSGSKSCERLDVTSSSAVTTGHNNNNNNLARRPPLPLPPLSSSSSSTDSGTLHGSPGRSRAKLTSIPLQERSSSIRLDGENCSWSQETLF